MDRDSLSSNLTSMRSDKMVDLNQNEVHRLAEQDRISTKDFSYASESGGGSKIQSATDAEAPLTNRKPIDTAHVGPMVTAADSLLPLLMVTTKRPRPPGRLPKLGPILGVLQTAAEYSAEEDGASPLKRPRLPPTPVLLPNPILPPKLTPAHKPTPPPKQTLQLSSRRRRTGTAVDYAHDQEMATAGNAGNVRLLSVIGEQSEVESGSEKKVSVDGAAGAAQHLVDRGFDLKFVAWSDLYTDSDVEAEGAAGGGVESKKDIAGKSHQSKRVQGPKDGGLTKAKSERNVKKNEVPHVRKRAVANRAKEGGPKVRLGQSESQVRKGKAAAIDGPNSETGIEASSAALVSLGKPGSRARNAVGNKTASKTRGEGEGPKLQKPAIKDSKQAPAYDETIKSKPPPTKPRRTPIVRTATAPSNQSAAGTEDSAAKGKVNAGQGVPEHNLHNVASVDDAGIAPDFIPERTAPKSGRPSKKLQGAGAGMSSGAGGAVVSIREQSAEIENGSEKKASVHGAAHPQVGRAMKFVAFSDYTDSDEKTDAVAVGGAESVKNAGTSSHPEPDQARKDGGGPKGKSVGKIKKDEVPRVTKRAVGKRAKEPQPLGRSGSQARKGKAAAIGESKSGMGIVAAASTAAPVGVVKPGSRARKAINNDTASKTLDVRGEGVKGAGAKLRKPTKDPKPSAHDDGLESKPPTAAAASQSSVETNDTAEKGNVSRQPGGPKQNGTSVDDAGIAPDLKPKKTVPKSGRPTSKKLQSAGAGTSSGTGDGAAQKKPVKRAKGAFKELGTLSLAAVKSVNAAAGESKKLIGAHVGGGLKDCVYNAAGMGCRAFALFLRSARAWKTTELEDDSAAHFKAAMKHYGYKAHQAIPHGSYLLNVGSSDEQIFTKSRDTMLHEVQRCQKLGLIFYNFHPGSTCGKISVEECISKIASCINYVIERTEDVTILVETMCGQGNTIGGTFAQLRAIIDLVEDKSRVGVCLDTCHVFAAGYDVKSAEGYQATMTDFADTIGLDYLKAIHLNDSKGEMGCHLDRHENIGEGKIGVDGFKNLMTDPLLDGIPMILETPEGHYVQEMCQLYDLE